MTRTIIKGGTIVSGKSLTIADIAYEKGMILEAAEEISPSPGDGIIEADGLLVLPGIIDAHTHIVLDTGIYATPDNWTLGTQIAAAGGVTTVIDFATQLPGQSFDEALDLRLKETEGAIIDYGLHCMITDFTEKNAQSLQTLIDRGVPSLKMYTTYRPNYYMDDQMTINLMRRTAEIGGLLQAHAENDSIVTDATEKLIAEGNSGWKFHAAARPIQATQEAVSRLVYLSEYTDCPLYIVHSTSAREVDLITEARMRGIPAWVETCPQYLLLDTGVFEGEHPEWYIFQPPLRDSGEPENLWERVVDGSVHVIGTDSCYYSIDQKRQFSEFRKTPGGIPGIETLLPLIYTYGVDSGRIGIIDLVRMLCENPARLFGLAPKKGFLKPGADADIVLFDPTPEGTIRHEDLHDQAGYNPYQGIRTTGTVKTTISRGEIIYQDGVVSGRKGRGQFVPGSPFSPNQID